MPKFWVSRFRCDSIIFMMSNSNINKVNRKYAVLKGIAEKDDVFVDAPADVLVGFMWELTAELYSLKDGFDAEQRLQRNVENLVRQ